MKTLQMGFISGVVFLSLFAIPPILEAASPLHMAAEAENSNEVIQLIKSGSNINEKTKSAYTPLHFSATLGHVKIVEITTIKGADVSIRDEHGRTSLDLAVLKENNEGILAFDQPNGNVDDKNGINWFITFYGAVWSQGNVAELIKDVDTSSNLLGLAVSRKMFNFFKHFDFELEGQVVKHLSGSDHWELNGLFLVRWLTFPWNHYVNTSFAVGEGFSYTTSEHKKEPDTVKGLNYLLFELALSLPEFEEWSFVGRAHHRSNIYGAMGPGKSISSNYIGLGVKYGFEGF